MTESHVVLLRRAFAIALFMSFVLTVMASSVRTVAADPPGTNLVHNGSFEQVRADNMPTGWAVDWAWRHPPNVAVTTTDAATDGERSFHVGMRDTTVPEAWGGRLFQNISVTGGAGYYAAVDIKMTEWMSHVGSEGASLAGWWQYKDGSWSDTFFITEELFEGNFDWQTFSVAIVAPEEAMNLRLGLWANIGLGDIWWDNVRLIEVPLDYYTGTPSAGQADDPTTALQAKIDDAWKQALLQVAEVNWPAAHALYEKANDAVHDWRADDTRLAQLRAEHAADNLFSMLYGSRIVETRAFWLDDEIMSPVHGFNNRRSVEQLLDSLAQMSVNKLYVNVYYNGQTMYPSNVAPRQASFARWEEDPLTVILDEARSRNMEVHAWYTVFVQSHHGTSAQLLQQNPGWAAQNRDGQTLSKLGEYWLDPAHPGAQQYMLDVMQELLTNYELDGLHLDYIRYDMELQFGPATVARFKDETGLDAHTVQPGTPEAEQLHRMRGQVITEFVQKVRELGRLHAPEAQISAAVAADYNWALQTIMQPWEDWVDQRLVDIIIPMVYSDDTADFARRTDNNVRRVADRVRMEIGLGIYMLTPKGVNEQIAALRERLTQGPALFAAVHLRQLPGIADGLTKGAFHRHAIAPTPGSPAADVFIADMAERLRDQTEFMAPGEDTYLLLALADSLTGDMKNVATLIVNEMLPPVMRSALRGQWTYAQFLLGN